MNLDYEFGGFLDALLARGIQFRRSLSDQAEISICCPFCSEARFRLGLNIRNGKGHCFNCDWRSRKAMEEVAEVLSLGVFLAESNEKIEEKPKPPTLPEDFTLLSDTMNDVLFWKAQMYMQTRGVSRRQWEEKRIGASFVGRYAYRIVFPIYYGQKLQGLVGRDFTGQQEPKYLNHPGMKVVYNLPKKRKSKAVLCEGIFDCLAIERAIASSGYDVLALLGHSVSKSQAAKLEDYDEIVLWPDADMPGIKGFLKVGQELVTQHSMWVVTPNWTAKDAGELSKNDLQALWATRTRLTDSKALFLESQMAFNNE